MGSFSLSPVLALLPTAQLIIAQTCDTYLLWQHPSALEPPSAGSKLNSGRKRSCSTQGLVGDFEDDTIGFVFFCLGDLVSKFRVIVQDLCLMIFSEKHLILQTCFKWFCFLALLYPFASVVPLLKSSTPSGPVVGTSPG